MKTRTVNTKKLFISTERNLPEVKNNTFKNLEFRMDDAHLKEVDVTDAFCRSTPTVNKFYNMNHRSRGRAVIFNHFHFKNNYSDRKGTDTDVKNLRKALLHLGFTEENILIYNDLTVLEIYKALENLQKEDHTDRDMLMVFVLSHGTRGDKVSAADVEYSVENLWEPFRADKCGSLAGKPKIFFVVACRGLAIDTGYEYQPSDDRFTEVDAKPIEPTFLIPVWSDFLYVFSTYKEHVSYRNIDQGTWYIQAFSKELSKTNISQVSFTDFLTLVNGRLSAHEAGPIFNRVKQIPIFSSTFTKNLYFTKKK